MRTLFTLAIFLFALITNAQHGYWQQRVEYVMDVDFDVKNHQFTGTQQLTYYNNSPDTLHRVFYHLYFNAFQPGSMMDVRSRTIVDPDRRVGNRIEALSAKEEGYLHVTTLSQDGASIRFNEEETVLSVELGKSLLPGEKTVFTMAFKGQVPVQIRRSGRDSQEGIAYSMAQWYPKMCEYDNMGWHANPYIAREFHGVWGDFDVKITIDPRYTLGGTGYLQNPNKIGHGYEDKGVKIPKHKNPITWHFKAPNVHDFMWAADPDYKHLKAKVPGGPELHFFYEESADTEAWEKLPEYTIRAFQYMNTHFGHYPWKQYSVVMGGDGGMEYPMSTLITGKRKLSSLVGVTVHEMVHSWYQGALANNESLYPWMDEGFTSYASSLVMQELFNQPTNENIHKGSYQGYFYNVSQGEEEPLTIHSDHYQSNRSYSLNAYAKGAVFLNQLSYIIGQEAFMRGMRRYYNTWQFKHPTPNDFIRIMEKESDIELDWYKEHFVYSTNTIDYSIETVEEDAGTTVVTLKRNNAMMMPIDLVIEQTNGEKILYYIPLKMMRGNKEDEGLTTSRMDESPWPWTNPEYEIRLPIPLKEIKSLEIDPTKRMADMDEKNNYYLAK